MPSAARIYIVAPRYSQCDDFARVVLGAKWKCWKCVTNTIALHGVFEPRYVHVPGVIWHGCLYYQILEELKICGGVQLSVEEATQLVTGANLR